MVLQRLFARLGSGTRTRPPLRFARRSRRAHSPPPRRNRHARRHRHAEHAEHAEQFDQDFSANSASSALDVMEKCPLKPMTESERIVADYAGTGLTVGRHPMALRREELAMRGVLRASDLRAARQGRRVRVAGMVITRQRPGTAKGFVVLPLEDETGIANIIVRPDLFARDRLRSSKSRF